MKMKTVLLAMLVVLFAGATAQVAGATTIITSPYSGADRLALHTDAGPHDQSYSGGMTDNGGVTYLKYGGDQTTVAMLDGVFSDSKFFMGANLHLNNPKSTALMDSNNPGTYGTGSLGTNWLWWAAHFTNPMRIDHFVIRTADHSDSRTPDQFQLRGSNDGGATWNLIYRLDADGDGTGTPGGAQTTFTPGLDYRAAQFDRLGDSFAAGTYKDIRLEVFSATNNGDGVGITEWQLAGIVPEPATMALLGLGGFGLLLRRKRK